jgi:hypothetical protein
MTRLSGEKRQDALDLSRVADVELRQLFETLRVKPFRSVGGRSDAAGVAMEAVRCLTSRSSAVR